jgi:tripartite-type tricarboxylate transporter receptor subunit TctC
MHTRIRRAALFLALLLAAGAALAEKSLAQAPDGYPSRVVSLVIPYPPGGSADGMARPLAQQISGEWPSPVIILSKPGAGTTIGAGFVASSSPDGYTLYIAAPSHVISGSLYKALRYDPVKSFAGISQVFSSPFIVAVSAKSGIHSLAELIARAKQNPGKLNFGSSGIGAGPHLSNEVLKKYAGIDVTHIPFTGAGQPLVELLAGRIDYIVTDASAMPMIRNGDVVPLAVTSPKRYPLLPEVPTVSELLPGAPDVTNWGVILAPAGTPAPIVQYINTSIAKALTAPGLQKIYEAQGYDVAPSSPEAADKFLASEFRKFHTIIDEAHIELQ